MIVDLLFETFFGALTGYVTNDIAIKTLFKPGGTIEKTREQFTKEIAALLESEIITPEALADILRLPEVTQELSNAIHSFLSDTIPSMIEELTINDLDHGALAQYLTKEANSLCTNPHFKEALSTSLKQSLTPEMINDILNLLKQFASLITEEAAGITFNSHTTILDSVCLADAEKAFADFSAQFSENLLAIRLALTRSAAIL